VERALRILAENRIMAAIAEGAFEGLPGSGAPLNLEDDSSTPEEWRLSTRVLRHNGFAPAWIEIGAEIRRRLDQARSGLAAVPRLDARRALAEAVYAARAQALNNEIARANLRAPGPRWHLPLIAIARDCAEVHPGWPRPAGGPEPTPRADVPLDSTTD
jgi:hypothetical protein